MSVMGECKRLLIEHVSVISYVPGTVLGTLYIIRKILVKSTHSRVKA